jgi:hypothetical protein
VNEYERQPAKHVSNAYWKKVRETSSESSLSEDGLMSGEIAISPWGAGTLKRKILLSV